ncbi:hypothetical protein GQ607_002360 [Colletotrichum asianum]|uniref:Uncharacterized protein n=1 Tax=Colletotrichum asianum TaxID=702518 RepID=A0A8H3WKT8_9PEZI|nr:hypothetical protein GQ607_002360 [Colletotrichum asianum]
MYHLHQRTACPGGSAFYVCSSNNFRGCCSQDPCALPSCPDTAPTPSPSTTSSFLTTPSTSFLSTSTALPSSSTTTSAGLQTAITPAMSDTAKPNGSHEAIPGVWIGLIIGLGIPLVACIGFAAMCIRKRLKGCPDALGRSNRTMAVISPLTRYSATCFAGFAGQRWYSGCTRRSGATCGAACRVACRAATGDALGNIRSNTRRTAHQ